MPDDSEPKDADEGASIADVVPRQGSPSSLAAEATSPQHDLPDDPINDVAPNGPTDSASGASISSISATEGYVGEPVFDAVGVEESYGVEAEPPLPTHVNVDDTDDIYKDSEMKVERMHKFTLYETNVRYWITGADITDKHFKILKIDRTVPAGQLSIFEDESVYTKREMEQMIKSIDDGNRATGGLRHKCSFWGILGFIRFTGAYYMLLITKRQQVAILGGHYIYQIDGTELVPLTTGPNARLAASRNAEESRFLGILNNLDLTRSFYFSYSYNITRTLQDNIIHQRDAINKGIEGHNLDLNDMFVWNHHLLEPVQHMKNPYGWCLPIIHGFIDQAALDVFGRSLYLTIIGRRSRFFAGARFLKRGANDLGYVANDVETEQIVSEMLSTSFHAPGPRLFSNPNYTSYVHHRGSIPLYWTQDNSGVSPKPDIDLNLTDPFYSSAALHFDDLFKRYGCQVYVLNLIKARERTPRESKLLYEFQNALAYLNQFLPEDKQILYKAFDMSRAAKTRGGDVIGTLEDIAEDIVQRTGFFRNGVEEHGTAQVQNGVSRTNCIDCLDRTNAAQFVIGKRALGHQLVALGVLPTPDMEYDSDAVNIFTHMFHDHGDTIAVQYGGSHLVNTMATYRKINHWQSHSRDMVESFKRYYHNSFLDSQRQEAYNLFLGNYIWSQGQPMLWDLATDYYLHHADPKTWLDRPRRSYRIWYDPKNLEPRVLPTVSPSRLTGGGVPRYDDYWLEYYRPLAISSFAKVYAFRINSNNRYLPDRPSKEGKFDFSPFVPRLDASKQAESPEKKPPPARKGVTIVDPTSENDTPHHRLAAAERERPDPRVAIVPESILRDTSAQKHQQQQQQQHAALHNNNNNSQTSTPKTTSDFVEDALNKAEAKAMLAHLTMNKIYDQSLSPCVTREETDEYEHYIEHPLRIPLIISSDFQERMTDSVAQYEDYVNGHRDEFDGDDIADYDIPEEELAEYEDYVTVKDDPLTVFEEDGTKKRYTAYKKWLRGKSLFKQSKVDPEYQLQVARV